MRVGLGVLVWSVPLRWIGPRWVVGSAMQPSAMFAELAACGCVPTLALVVVFALARYPMNGFVLAFVPVSDWCRESFLRKLTQSSPCLSTYLHSVPHPVLSLPSPQIHRSASSVPDQSQELWTSCFLFDLAKRSRLCSLCAGGHAFEPTA